jgi:hypothetical protein
MKQFFAGCVVVLVAAVGVQFASSATSKSSRSIPARVKALEKKVKTLTASVATLKARADCLGAVGVTQYGNPTAGQGYFYTNDGGATVGLTTGLDATASGGTPTFLAATVNPACISGSRAFRMMRGTPVHRTALFPGTFPAP